MKQQQTKPIGKTVDNNVNNETINNVNEIIVDTKSIFGVTEIVKTIIDETTKQPTTTVEPITAETIEIIKTTITDFILSDTKTIEHGKNFGFWAKHFSSDLSIEYVKDVFPCVLTIPFNIVNVFDFVDFSVIGKMVINYNKTFLSQFDNPVITEIVQRKCIQNVNDFIVYCLTVSKPFIVEMLSIPISSIQWKLSEQPKQPTTTDFDKKIEIIKTVNPLFVIDEIKNNKPTSKQINAVNMEIASLFMQNKLTTDMLLKLNETTETTETETTETETTE